eukprot:365253-Chlamydomonas_euryale.AAC.26
MAWMCAKRIRRSASGALVSSPVRCGTSSITYETSRCGLAPSAVYVWMNCCSAFYLTWAYLPIAMHFRLELLIKHARRN